MRLSPLVEGGVQIVSAWGTMDVIPVEGETLAKAMYLVFERHEGKGNCKDRIGWLLSAIES